MTNNESTNSARASSRDDDVRAHEQAQYATPPYLPSLPTGPTEENPPHSTPVRPAGFRNARGLNDDLTAPEPENHPEPAIDDNRRIVGYRVNRTNSTVLLASLARPITEILKRKTWTTLVPDIGWMFPVSYLAFVERLLAGADIPIEIFNIDGGPTPGQLERHRREERGQSAAVIAEIRAARKASQTDSEATTRARLACREAFANAVAAHPPVDTARTPSTTDGAVQ